MKTLLPILMLFVASIAVGQLRPPLAGTASALPSEFRMSAAPAIQSGGMFDQADESGGKKSVGLAAIYSLLLPGMGELYAGNYGMGKYFTIAEGGLIVALIGMDRYANWLQDDARRYAVQYAHISLDGKDDRFFNAIGNFNDVNHYNDQVERDGDFGKTYDPSPGSAYYWNWDNPVNRESYRDVRISSDERFNDTRFIAAAIAVNHVVSAINAARIAFSHNKSLLHGNAIDLHADVIGGFAHPSGVRLTLTRIF